MLGPSIVRLSDCYVMVLLASNTAISAHHICISIAFWLSPTRRNWLHVSHINEFNSTSVWRNTKRLPHILR